MDNKRIHVFVEGRVQGVGFRYFTKQYALAFELKGWVRNTLQGEVELVAEGEIHKIENFIQLLRRGPSGAYVENLRIEWETPMGEYKQFSIASTT